jgi:hypothetical protein
MKRTLKKLKRKRWQKCPIRNDPYTNLKRKKVLKRRVIMIKKPKSHLRTMKSMTTMRSKRPLKIVTHLLVSLKWMLCRKTRKKKKRRPHLIKSRLIPLKIRNLQARKARKIKSTRRRF